MLCECSSVTELVNKIIVVCSSKHLYEFDDIRVVDFRENGDFVIGELTKFRSMFKLLNIHNFDSIELMSFLIFCLVNIAILPLSYFFYQDVILDNLIH